MRLPIIAFLFILLLFVNGCVTPSVPKWKPLSEAELQSPLSLNKCIGIARRNDVRVAEWRARLAAARGELTTARTLPNPTLSMAWEDVGIKDAAGKSVATSTYGISYPIFFWWTRDRDIAIAKKKFHSEKEGVLADQRQLAIDVGSSYFAILGAQRKEKATEALLEEAQEAQRLAEESLSLGLVSGHDRDLALTEVQQSEAELFDARHETLAQRLSFAFALGADHPLILNIDDMILSVPLGYEVPATTVTVAVPLPEALIAKALSADPTYTKAKSEREAAEASYQLEVRRILPLSDTAASIAAKHTPDGNGRNYGLDLPIPFFNWNLGGIKKAKADLLAKQAEEETARREVVANLSESWESYQSTSRRYAAYSQRLVKERAKLAADAQDLFAEGQISYTDLLQARREWRQAEIDAVDSWRENMASLWKILNQTGAECINSTGLKISYCACK